ncbi:MAG: M23 family metallopeptidase [Leptospiraceae bacterium]|nr:M23 family metallopeptidase [Leptospiraceae bacterium]MDW8307676.1 M23 family metallopeptidase [Leptospiraceae bacterium]
MFPSTEEHPFFYFRRKFAAYWYRFRKNREAKRGYEDRVRRPILSRQDLGAQSLFTLLLVSHRGRRLFGITLSYLVSYFLVGVGLMVFVFSVAATYLYFKGMDLREQLVEESQQWEVNLKLIALKNREIREYLRNLEAIGNEMYQTIWKEEIPSSKRALSSLSQEFYERTQGLLKALRFFYAREDALQNMPRGMPLESGYITSLYGHRISPFGFEVNFHSGIDLANSIGTPVLATADGEVVTAKTEGGGYGKHVRILHKYGLVTLYAHLQALKVEQGQRVKRGDVIGFLGQSGNATGPHLHYEVRLRNPDIENVLEITLNPWPFIKDPL